MKIGILTYFGDLNAGTNLQAYATLSNVRKTFPEAQVEIINYHAWHIVRRPYFSSFTIFTLLNDIKRIRKYNSFTKNSLSLSNESLTSSDYDKSISFIEKQKYDRIYVGADTLLELQRVDDTITAYWLSERVTSQKYLLAASARNLIYEELTPNQKQLIHRTLSAFNLMGVRDDSTYRLLANFVDDKNKLSIIPDPTFALDIDYSIVEKYVRKRGVDFIKPTICFHVRRDDEWANDVAKEFKKRGFQIASLRPAKFADIILNDMSPFEHIGIFKYFKLMITNKFHDTVFCFKNGTPMITIPFNETYTTNYGESKYYSLFKLFSLLETNYFDNLKEIDSRMILGSYENAISSFNSKKESIDNKLTELNNRYLSFLKSTHN